MNCQVEPAVVSRTRILCTALPPLSFLTAVWSALAALLTVSGIVTYQCCAVMGLRVVALLK